MQGSKPWVRGVLRIGTLCGVFAMLLLVTGCPPITTPCTNFDVDDGDACTTDTCDVVDGEATAVNTPVECDAGSVCVDGDCVEDLCADADCDDGDACTDDDCDVTTGECTYANNTAACDDDDACTESDVCADGACAGTAVDCDDGDACTDDSCDAATACVHDAVVCGTNEECDPVTGLCEPLGCADDAICDDGDACTVDTCDVGTGLCDNSVAVDCDDGDECTVDSCDSATGCANTPMDCDDGDACTVDSCDAGVCVNDAMTCPPGEECVDGVCTPIPCTADVDCDDLDACTGAETCVDGACTAGTAVDCDDADACTTDTCDPADGTCTNDAVVCEVVGDVCTDGVCGPVVICTLDTECDDLLYCNGAETCTIPVGETEGTCTAGTAPCGEGISCDEDTDACPGTTFSLTNSTTEFDSIVGTPGDDTITGGPNSLQTGDVIDGAGGNDTVNVSLAGTAALPVIANVETINFSLLASTNITSSAISAAADGTTLTSTAGTGITLTLTSFQEEVSLAMSGAGNMTIASLAVPGTGDVINLAIAGDVGTFTDTSSHINQLNISATGSKVTVGGGTLDSSATTEKATWTSTADLTVEDTAATNQFNAKYIDASGVTGTCTLEIDADMTAGGAETLGMVNMTGVDRLLFSQDQSGANAFTITGSPDPFEIEAKDNNANPHIANNLIVDNTSLTGAANTLTLKLGGDGDATGIGGNFSAVGYETVNLEVSSSGATVGTYILAGTTALDTGTVDRIETVNVSGDQNVTFTGALTLDMLDASGLTKSLTLTAGAANTGTIMRGGTSADTLDQTANVATIVQGNGGADVIDGDNGSTRQEVRYAELTDGASAGASTGFDVVTKFDVGAGDNTDDIFALVGNLRIALDDGTVNGTLAWVTSTGGGNDAVAATDEALFVAEAQGIANITTPSDIATLLNAQFALSNFATAGDDLFWVVPSPAATETWSWGVYVESGTGSEAQASEITILGSATESAAAATLLATGDFLLK